MAGDDRSWQIYYVYLLCYAQWTFAKHLPFEGSNGYSKIKDYLQLYRTFNSELPFQQ